jgi:hypothetical protein
LKNLQTTVHHLKSAGLWFRNSLLDAETARLLGMLEDKDTNLVRQVVEHITPRSHPTYDFHYLGGALTFAGSSHCRTHRTHRPCDLNLDRKLEGQQQRAKQNWNLRLSEVVTNLIKRDLQLPEALLKHPDFPRPAHVDLVSVLDAKYRARAARWFLAAVQKTPNFPWSGPLIELLSSLPADEVRPAFRQQWSNFALRDELLLKLAVKPDPDRPGEILFGLSFRVIPIARASLAALADLPRSVAKQSHPGFPSPAPVLSDPNERPCEPTSSRWWRDRPVSHSKSRNGKRTLRSLKKVYHALRLVHAKEPATAPGCRR